jgi:phospholipid/cholesterol/gamma-HCH transport system substrate-binding protein
MRRGQKRGLGYVPTALIVLALAVVGTWLAFRKELPFRSHFEVDAVVKNANQLRAGSAVRIAGVDVGKVVSIEPVGDGRQAARIRMRIVDKARPLHQDATLKVRPRILLEGNFFVDLSPGSPSSPELRAGGTIPVNQTAGPVQLDQVLGALRADTRKDLKGLLHELNTGLSGGGATAVNRTIPYWAPAYRGTAIVNDATLGLREHDLSGYIAGAGRVAEGLDRNSGQLQSLIGDLRVTAAAFGREDEALKQALGELPRTLRAAMPALAKVNAALPALRQFTADLRPGVRNAGASLDAQVPFVRELRGLVQPAELRGLTADLEETVPALTALNDATIPLLEQARAASSCQNEVVLPWTKDTVPDEDFPSVGPVYQEQVKPLVGLAGESRTFDANGQWFRVALNAGQFATPLGAGNNLLTDRPILGVDPPPGPRPPMEPSVACETQTRPDLRTREAQPPQPSFKVRAAPADAEAKARETAVKWLQRETKSLGQTTKVVDDVLEKADIAKLSKDLPKLTEAGKR